MEIKREDVVNIDNKVCPRTYICATDSRFNYTFCKEEDIKENNNLPDVIGREMIDYGIDNTEQGEEWYRQKFPNLPEDFYGIIARYQWGQPQTKKSIKNEVKKVKRNPKKVIPQGLTCIKGKFSVQFDQRAFPPY